VVVRIGFSVIVHMIGNKMISSNVIFNSKCEISFPVTFKGPFVCNVIFTKIHIYDLYVVRTNTKDSFSILTLYLY